MFSKPGSGPAVLRKVSLEAAKVDPAKRRDFLKKGLAVAGGAIVGAPLASTLSAADNNLPPNLPEHIYLKTEYFLLLLRSSFPLIQHL